MRQLMTESIVLSVAAGAFGLLIASWAGRVLMTMIAAGTVSGTVEFGRAPMAFDIRLDFRVFAFTMAVSCITSVLFGLAPAVLASSSSLAPALATRGAVGVRRFGLGKVMVVVQVALTVVLLCGAGLFLRTLRNLRTQNLGFAMWASCKPGCPSFGPILS